MTLKSIGSATGGTKSKSFGFFEGRANQLVTEFRFISSGGLERGENHPTHHLEWELAVLTIYHPMA